MPASESQRSRTGASILERANQDWEKNTFAGQTINKAQSALPPVHESPAGSGDPVTAYLRARAVKESFAARTAQLEYEERAGKLIQATKAGEYAAHWSAIVGDALSAYPDRVAPLVAAAKTEAEIHRILAGETNALRRKMAKAISDAGY